MRGYIYSYLLVAETVTLTVKFLLVSVRFILGETGPFNRQTSSTDPDSRLTVEYYQYHTVALQPELALCLSQRSSLLATISDLK